MRRIIFLDLGTYVHCFAQKYGAVECTHFQDKVVTTLKFIWSRF